MEREQSIFEPVENGNVCSEVMTKTIIMATSDDGIHNTILVYESK